MAKFCILLSTYQNHAYLEELVNSIEKQTNQDWIIYWREDSNSRNSILESRGGKFLECHSDQFKSCNIGVRASFLLLLTSAPASEHYIFCDQDDVWEPNRLDSILFKKPKNEYQPRLLIQNGRLLGEGILPSKIINESLIFRENLIFDNAVPGCCMAINEAGRIKLIQECNFHRTDYILHDWMILIFAFVDNWIIDFDPNCHLQYRIHPGNTIGLPGPSKKIVTLIVKRKLLPYMRSHLLILRHNLSLYTIRNKSQSRVAIKLKAAYHLLRLNFTKGLLLIPFILSA